VLVVKFVFCDQLEQFRMTLSLEIITGFTTGLVVSMTGHFMYDANDNNAQKSIRRRVVIH
jgi:L-cystine uptake protein TcyP (sodium:dicarboxylate symporter family)